MTAISFVIGDIICDMCYCYIIWWWPHERAFAIFIGSNLKHISSKLMWFSCQSSMTINCITICSFREFLSDNIHYWPHSTLLTTQFMQLDALPLQSKLRWRGIAAVFILTARVIPNNVTNIFERCKYRSWSCTRFLY